MKKSRWLLLFLIIGVAIPPASYAFDEDEIRELISGKTIRMYHRKKDFNLTRYFREDGVLFEEHEERGFRKGHWEIDGNKLCFTIGKIGAKCRPVIEKKGETGTGNKKGKKLIVVFEEILEGNHIKIPEDKKPGVDISAIREEVITINTRGNVTQSFLLIEPEDTPKGVVVLYPGHEGVVRFKKIGDRYSVDNEGGGITASEKTRDVLSQNGYAVAVLAAPSDQVFGMDTNFRSSDEHATDAKSVIDYLRNKFNQDVYLHGHCRSSFSPPAVATRLNNKGIKGLILSSTRSEGKHGSVMDLDKNAINVPVLLVHHTEDPCDGTPYKNIPEVKAFYESSSPKVDLISVTGGNGDRGPNAPGCSGGYHAFKGIQKPVVNAIVKWLDGAPFPEHLSK